MGLLQVSSAFRLRTRGSGREGCSACLDLCGHLLSVLAAEAWCVNSVFPSAVTEDRKGRARADDKRTKYDLTVCYGKTDDFRVGVLVVRIFTCVSGFLPVCHLLYSQGQGLGQGGTGTRRGRRSTKGHETNPSDLPTRYRHWRIVGILGREAAPSGALWPQNR